MKPKSISGLIYFVSDTKKTAEFYEKLGFIITRRDREQVSVRINWFWIDFLVADAMTPPKSPEQMVSSQFLYINVVDVDQTHKDLIKRGITSVSEPQDYKSGRREVMISDPDGYKLVFFQKIK